MHLLFRFLGPKKRKSREVNPALYRVELRNDEAVRQQGIVKIYFDELRLHEDRKLKGAKPVAIVSGILKDLSTKLTEKLHGQGAESDEVDYHFVVNKKIDEAEKERIKEVVKTTQKELEKKNSKPDFSNYECLPEISEQELFSRHIKPTDRVVYIGANSTITSDSALSHIGTILAKKAVKNNSRLTLVDRDHSMIWPEEHKISEHAKQAFRKLGNPRGSGDPIYYRLTQNEFLRQNPGLRMTRPKIVIADVMNSPILPASKEKLVDHGSNFYIVGAGGSGEESFLTNIKKLIGEYDKMLSLGGKAIITFSLGSLGSKSNKERTRIMIRRFLEHFSSIGYKVQVYPLAKGHYEISGKKLSEFHHLAIVATKPRGRR